MLFFRQLKYFKQLLPPIGMLAVIIIVGMIGYMIIEGYPILDALYMTVITIGSVGYAEVHPLSDAGRVFTIVLIILNLGTFTFFITLLTRYLIDGEFIKQYKLVKMETMIKKLNNHVIICGLGRNGKECARILHHNQIPFVVIEDKEPDTEDLDFNIDYILRGNATKDELLLESGIKNARAIISTLPLDADNVFVVLTSRQLNPNLTIISRASHDSSVDKLKIAGATNVIMPDKIGGAHMATLVMIPDVVELVSMMGTTKNEQFNISEIMVTRSAKLEQLNLWLNTGCTILGIKDASGNYLMNPPPAKQIAPGDRLIIMGSKQEVAKATTMV
ncbi:MAG: potassium channel protein [Dinghuibacter sp.]|nr:potassium channel protein [Dinghuibacter sp.]